MQDGIKKTKTALCRYRKEIYIVKKSRPNKHWMGFQHVRCQERIRQRQLQERDKWQDKEKVRLLMEDLMAELSSQN